MDAVPAEASPTAGGQSAQLSVTIVGGGIAGLAAAVALQRRGIAARVFERDPQFEGRKQGYGLTLQSTQALDDLGILDEVRACDTPSVEHWTFKPDGSISGYFGNAFRKFADGQTLGLRGNIRIPREDLRRILLAKLAPDTVTWGVRLRSYDERSDCVVSVFESCGVVGSEAYTPACTTELAGQDAQPPSPAATITVTSTVLVGADGIHSIVRRLMAANGSPAPVGSSGALAVADVIADGGEAAGAVAVDGAEPRAAPGGATASIPAALQPPPSLLSYLGVLVILGISTYDASYFTDGKGFYTVDGVRRLFVMPFLEGDQRHRAVPGTSAPAAAADFASAAASGDNDNEGNNNTGSGALTMWQLSIGIASVDEARAVASSGPSAILRRALDETEGWHAPVQELIKHSIIEGQYQLWCTPLYDYGEEVPSIPGRFSRNNSHGQKGNDSRTKKDGNQSTEASVSRVPAVAMQPNVNKRRRTELSASPVAAAASTTAESAGDGDDNAASGSIPASVTADGQLPPQRKQQQHHQHQRPSRIGPRVTLIGDAAHPMSPFKGQGANQALRDGPALAEWLAKTLDQRAGGSISAGSSAASAANDAASEHVADTAMSESVDAAGGDGATHDAAATKHQHQNQQQQLNGKKKGNKRAIRTNVHAAILGFEREMMTRAGAKVLASRQAAQFYHSNAILTEPLKIAGVNDTYVTEVLSIASTWSHSCCPCNDNGGASSDGIGSGDGCGCSTRSAGHVHVHHSGVGAWCGAGINRAFKQVIAEMERRVRALSELNPLPPASSGQPPPPGAGGAGGGSSAGGDGAEHGAGSGASAPDNASNAGAFALHSSPSSSSSSTTSSSTISHATDPKARATLLYYCYVELSRNNKRDEVAQWYNNTCGAGKAGTAAVVTGCDDDRNDGSASSGSGTGTGTSAGSAGDSGGGGSRGGVVGRVRVANDGVNATLGGTRSALERHIAEMRIHPIFREQIIDFKLSLSDGPRSAEAIPGCHFDAFQVKLCTEIVTLQLRREDKVRGRAKTKGKLEGMTSNGNDDGDADTDNDDDDDENEGDQRPVTTIAHPSHAGIHLDPASFHTALIAPADVCKEVGLPKADVLIDVRNGYEHDIGHFDVPSSAGVKVLLPQTRTFAEMPAWFESHRDDLAGKNVLMYCTGGVRCERASAYLREMGSEFSKVYQLRGGIQRYMEAGLAGRLQVKAPAAASTTASQSGIVAAADGDAGTTQASTTTTAPAPASLSSSSLFAGKMFVFDERPAVPVAPIAPASSGLTSSISNDTASVAATTADSVPAEVAQLQPSAGSHGPTPDICANVIGRCLVCARPWDAYNWHRCSCCGVLVLQCDACAAASAAGGAVASTPATTGAAESTQPAPTTGGDSAVTGRSTFKLVCKACRSTGRG